MPPKCLKSKQLTSINILHCRAETYPRFTSKVRRCEESKGGTKTSKTGWRQVRQQDTPQGIRRHALRASGWSRTANTKGARHGAACICILGHPEGRPQAGGDERRDQLRIFE